MNGWNEPSGKTDLAHLPTQVSTRVPRHEFILDGDGVVTTPNPSFFLLFPIQNTSVLPAAN